MPRLSYIIPAYNAERTLDQTVRSVLAQTEREIEAVIVDDGSTDGTRHAAGAMLGPRVALVSQANRGLAAARNAGWRAARADRVCFLDADDVIAPTHGATMLAAIGEADAVACGHEMVGPGLEPLHWRVPAIASDSTLSRLLEGNRTPVGSIVLDTGRVRARLGGNAGFDESLPVVEDWDLWLRMALAGAAWAPPVEDALFHYRLTPGSMSSDTGLMWRTGVGLLARHVGDARDLAHGVRCWSVQSLAKAVAAEQTEVVRAIGRSLGDLRAEDLPGLVGALRWSLARMSCAGPREWARCMPAWTQRVHAVLGEHPMATQILDALASGPHRWRAIVERAAGMLRPGERLVVYGYGRNGREAVRAACDLGLAVSVIDDDPRALGKLPSMRTEDLAAEDVVLVTPEERGRILARLAERGVRRVVLPDAA